MKFDFSANFGGLEINTKLEFVYTFSAQVSITVTLHMEDSTTRQRFYIVADNAMLSDNHVVYDFTFWFKPVE